MRSPRYASASASSSLPVSYASEDVLTFRAFYQEGAGESLRPEIARVRLLLVKMYVSKKTVAFEMSDYGLRNDGTAHGKFMKRAPIEGIDVGNYVELVRVGADIPAHGRVLHIFASDEHARKHYEDRGSPLDADEPEPVDEFSREMKTELAKFEPDSWHGVKSSSMTRYLEVRVGAGMRSFKDTKARYLQYSDLVLRFLTLIVDESGALEEHRTRFWLSFYYASEEVEIAREKGQQGTIFPKVLVARARLPKRYLGHDSRARECDEFDDSADYYHAEDLHVGATVNASGRCLLLCDCDAATQAFYAQHGVDQKAHTVDLSIPAPPPRPVVIPPHTGFGGEEDSLQSVKSLVPRPVRKPMLEHPAPIIMFRLRMLSTDAVNASRELIATLYPDDSEVALYEPTVRNSGVASGPFLRRIKLRNPATGSWYQAADFVPGGRIEINSYAFAVIEKVDN